MYPDRLLVSPAPAGGNTNWFDPFFQVLVCKIQSWSIAFVFAIKVVFHSLKSKTYRCTTPSAQACEELGCRIDYLATHDYEGNAKHVMNRLEMLYNR